MNLKHTLIFVPIITIIDIPWIKYVMSSQYKDVFDIKMKPEAAFMAYICLIICYPLIISKFDTLKEQLMIANTLDLLYMEHMDSLWRQFMKNILLILQLWKLYGVQYYLL